MRGKEVALCGEEFETATDIHFTQSPAVREQFPPDQVRADHGQWRLRRLDLHRKAPTDPMQRLAAEVLKQALKDLRHVNRLEPEEQEDLHRWFEENDPRNPFSLQNICVFTNQSMGRIRRHLPYEKAARCRYSAEYLRAQRLRIGWSQARVAERIGAQERLYKMWESGARPVPGKRVAALDALFFPPTLCKSCGTLRRQLESGGLTCPVCSLTREDREDLHARCLDRGEWVGATFLKKHAA